MKFEFRLQSSKEKKRKLIKKPNIFKLFKSRDVEKEIVTGIPVSTDLFNRTLYTTPNGNFRALGDEYNLYSNVFQGQNNFVTLAPPREEDEEDTRPPEKLNKNIGTTIVTPPPPRPLWNLCYPVWDENYKRRIYMTELPLEEDKITAVEVFNPFDERYKEEYPELATMYIGGAFGFYNNTFLMWGWPGRPTLYKVDYNGNILQKEPKYEDWQAVGSSYSIYKNRFYFAYFYGNYESVRVDCLNEDLTVDHIWENTNVGSLEYVKIWKNFVAYSERDPNKLIIFDYINNKKVCEVSDSELNYNFYIGNMTSDTACFVAGKWDNDRDVKGKQFCIILNQDGAYQVIENIGISLNVDADNEKAIVYYYPYNTYGISCVGESGGLAVHNGILYMGAGTEIARSYDGKNWETVRGLDLFNSYINCMVSSQGRLIFGGSVSYYTYSGSQYTNKYICNVGSASSPEGDWDIQIISRDGDWETKNMFALDNGDVLLYGGKGYSYQYSDLPNKSLILYRSTDGGLNWSLFKDISIYSDNLLYLGGGRLLSLGNPHYYSTDYGNSWQSLSDNDIFPDRKEGQEDQDLSVRFTLTKTATSCNLDNRGQALMVAPYFKAYLKRNSDGQITNWYYVETDVPSGYIDGTKVPAGYTFVLLNNEYRFYRADDGIHFNYISKVTDKHTTETTFTAAAARAIVGINGAFFAVTGVPKWYSPTDLYRSTDGYSWSEMPNYGYIDYVHAIKTFKFGNIVLGPYYKSPSTDLPLYSDDNLYSWKELNVDHTGIIELYERTGNTYNLKKRYEIQSPDFEPQQDMGHWNSYCRLYRSKFYIQDYIFNLITGKFSKENFGKEYNLFLDRFRFYSRYDETYGWRNCYYVYDLETNKEILLKPYYYPDFTSNHAMTYYLR